MEAIQFDTGVKTFSLNDKCEISFNPTDSAFAEKLFNAFDTLDKKQEEYRREAAAARDPRQIFAFVKERDAEMRTLIDDTLGAPVCSSLFANMNVYALANGLPVWCNLMFAIMDEMDTAFAREQKAANPRIQKYTAKYHR